MPIYEFLCPECGNRFEELEVSPTEDAECPNCGSLDARRQLSAPAPPPRLVLGSGAARRMEDKRGIDRGGAKQRFRDRRARERRAGGGDG